MLYSHIELLIFLSVLMPNISMKAFYLLRWVKKVLPKEKKISAFRYEVTEREQGKREEASKERRQVKDQTRGSKPEATPRPAFLLQI